MLGRPADRSRRVHADHRLADRAERVGEVQLRHRDALEHVGRLADDDGVDVGPRHARVVERLLRGLAHETCHRHVLARRAVHRLAHPDNCNPIAGHDYCSLWLASLRLVRTGLLTLQDDDHVLLQARTAGRVRDTAVRLARP